MARSSPMPSLVAIPLLLLFLLSSMSTFSFAKVQNKNVHFNGFLKKEKLAKFRFYWHDIVGGKNPTAVQIIPPVSNTSSSAFGLTRIVDNPLTEGPELNSKLLGRSQGFYSSASQKDFGFLMVTNLNFVQGKYNGSTITVLGRNPVLNKVRELPVIGGTGLFRFARGYVELRTHWVDIKTADAVVEYTAFVIHY